MDTKDFNKFANVFRSITGSTIKDAEMWNRYNVIDIKRRNELFGKVHTIIQNRNVTFNEALPLIAVDLSILAAEENLDPAVLLMLYVVNLNK